MIRKELFLVPALLLIFTSCFSTRVKAGSPAGTKKHVVFSSPTDHFRSIVTGDWNSTATWETSPNNVNWFTATLIPNSAASSISIINGHTVTVNSNEDMDDVVIQSGGILFHSSNTLTVNNGSGDDIVVQNGGIFTLASSANAPAFSVSATVFLNSGGILRVAAGGLTNAGTGVHASNFVYSDASVLEYTVAGAFSADGVTYFPNVNPFTIPIFRTTGNAGSVGGSGNLTINGLFEANGNVTFQNAGFKIFRNGITGTGNISGSAGSGKFVIGGLTAKLGGTGTLTLPTAGMDIGNSTTVNMISDKAMTGTITLLSNALVMLGIYHLTMTGSINGGSPTSHIVTNGSGKLVINNVGAGFSFFPVGATSTKFNPMVLSNGGGLNYGIRIEMGISPAIAFPANAVNRTWFVTPSGGIPGTVNTNFFYYPGEGNAAFNYSANVELGIYVVLWNVIQASIAPAGMYEVATTVSSFNNNTEAPLVLGNLGAILAVNNSVHLTAQKQNDKVVLTWRALHLSTVERFIVQRSAEGRAFTELIELPSTDFSFTDVHLLPGLNYYRIKMKDMNADITYSNITVILNAAKGTDFISITPNPVVNGSFKLNVTAAHKTTMDIVITDMQGRLIQKQTMNAIAGFNTIPVNVASFAKGMYQLFVNTGEGRAGVLRFVVQ